MSPLLVPKVDRRAAGAELVITNERRTVGEDLANWIFPTEGPLESVPSTVVVTRVSDALNFTEVTVSPAATQYRVEYDPDLRLGGGIEFAPADAGAVVDIDYKGTGSNVFARDVNTIHQKLDGVKVLTDGATIAWDLSNERTAEVTLAGNRTLGAPTGIVAGATYLLYVIQDATGGRTLVWDAAYKFPGGTDPVPSTAAGAVDILSFTARGAFLYGVAQKAFA